MKKLLAFALTCMLCTSTFYGQNDWKPGFIIKNPGDTVYGLIDNRDSKSFSKQCVFKKEETSEMEKFGPDEILGYRFTNDRFFVSMSLPDKDSTQKVFLEFLVNGTVDIFHYKDEEDHFYIEKDGKLYELKNTTQIIKTQSTSLESEKLVEHQKKEYIGILNSLMQDANMVQNINTSILGRDPLIKLAKEYHESTCPDEACLIYEKKKEKINIRLGLHVGGSMNYIKWGNFHTNKIYNCFFGLRIKFENLVAWSENFSFSTDITIQKYSINVLNQSKTSSSSIEYKGTTYSIDYGDNMNVDLNMLFLKLPITANYTFSHGNIRPYFNIGISNLIYLSHNEIYYLSYNSEGETEKSPLPVYLGGLIIRLGSQFNLKNGNYIYADLSYDNTFVPRVNLVFSDKMYSFTLGYSF